MKKINILFFLFCFFSITLLAKGEKRALLISIGDYNKKWKTLDASKNDFKLMKKILLQQSFDKKNIDSLIDTDATKANILKKIATLITSTKEGDVVVIYFSGHGVQSKDILKVDEKDKQDEYIVPYDAPAKNSSNEYSTNSLIVDDVIGEWISQLQVKVKNEGQVFVVIDACHSGTANKGDDEEKANQNSNEMSFSENRIIQNYFNLSLPKEKNTTKGKYVFMGSCADRQSSEQFSPNNKDVFSTFTYCLYKAFQAVSPDKNYKWIFSYALNYAINYKSNSSKLLNQKPVMDGNSEMLVFGGNVVKPNLEFTFIKITDKKVKLSSGSLENVNKGAKFEFRNNDSNNTPSIAKGIVTESNAFESIVEINENRLPENMKNIVAVQTVQAFGGYKVGVNFKNFKDKTLQKSLENSFNNKNILSISKENPELQLEEVNEHVVISIVGTGLVLKKIIKDESTTENVINKMLDYAKTKIISDLEINNPDFKAEVSLRHGSFQKKLNKDEKVEYINTSSREELLNQDLVFDTTQQSYFSIKNVGNKTFQFALLDIQPDGIINVLLPNIKQNWGEEDLKLAKGQTLEIPFNPPKPPYGIEIYKIIMSDNFEDFAFLNSIDRESIDDNKKGEDSPIVALFKDLTDGTMKRTKGNLPVVGGTAEIRFQIIPAKK